MNADKRGLRSEAGDDPTVAVALVENSIVQAADAALPEFDALRFQAVSTPVLRTINLTIAILPTTSA